MSRKTNNSALTSIASVALALDDSTPHTESKRHNQNSAQSRNFGSNRALQTRTPESTADESSSQDSGSDEEAADDSGVSGTASGDEADEEENEDEEPDAFAPPDRLHYKDGQAGRVSVSDSDCESGSVAEDGQSVEAVISNHGANDRSSQSAGQGNGQSDLDDDDYNAVDMISDSDDEDPDVEKDEEQNIIQSVESNDSELASALMDSISSDALRRSRPSLDLEEDLLLSDIPYFDEQYGRLEESILADEIDTFNPASLFNDFTLQTPSTRRVRFLTPVFPQSEDSDVDSDNEDLSILFSQNHPSGIFEELDADIPRININDDDDESCGSSSGYETDDGGDTTDEEEVPTSTTKKPQALLRRPSPTSDVPDSPTSPFKMPTTPASYRRGPRMCTWVTDPRKPAATIDSTGETMVIFPAKRPAMNDNVSLSAGSGTSTPVAPRRVVQPTLAAAPEMSDNDFSDFAGSQVSMDPILSVGTETAMTGLFDGAFTGTEGGNQAISLSPVFFPREHVANLVGSFPPGDLDGDDDVINVSDYFDFDGGSSEDGVDDMEASQAYDLPAPNKLQSQSSSSTPLNELIRHFDKGVIGAFRRSQIHPTSASRHPHNGLYSHSYAIKGGRHVAANAPLVSKKRKLSDGFGMKTAFGSPPKKRLFS